MDRFGPRKLMSFAIGLCAVASIGFSLSQSLFSASVSRALVGATVAFAFVGTLTIAGYWFAPKRFAMLAGVLQALGMCGAMLGQAPLALLVIQKASMTFTGSGITWSLLAGTVGAIGAFGVLLAFGAGGKPAVVMSVIFAGAPIINAVVAITLAGAWGKVSIPFIVGVLMAAAGAFMVVQFRPH